MVQLCVPKGVESKHNKKESTRCGSSSFSGRGKEARDTGEGMKLGVCYIRNLKSIGRQTTLHCGFGMQRGRCT